MSSAAINIILAPWFQRRRGLVVGINQFTYAFGPSLVGVIRDWSGGYGLALGACTALQAIGAALIVLGPRRASTR